MHDHVHGAATTLANAGRLAAKLGDLTEVAALLHESLKLKREIQDDRGVAVALIGLADVAMAAGDDVAARTSVAGGLALAQRVSEVKLVLPGMAVYGTLLCQEHADPTPGARLLAFVAGHPALPQEVRVQVEETRVTLRSVTWEDATAWAGEQTLAPLVAELLAVLAPG